MLGGAGGTAVTIRPQRGRGQGDSLFKEIFFKKGKARFPLNRKLYSTCNK